MSEIRKLKRGISTKPGQQHPCHEWEEQQRYWPSSPRAPPASPTESPRTPGGSQKKAVLGKVKSKAKKWMHMLHHKKKPAPPEEMMWTPRAGPGPSAQDSMAMEERHADAAHSDHRGTPRKPQQHAPSCSSSDPERASEVFLEASPRQNSPVPSPTAHREQQQPQPYFKVSSRFESEMKEANEMLMESKKLRVNTTKTKPKPKTVTFAPPTVEREQPGLGDEKSGWDWKDCRRELPGAAFRDAFAAVRQTVLEMVARIQEAMALVGGRRHVVEKLVSVGRYLVTKLEPGQDDALLSEAITDAVLDLFDAWSESVEKPLVRRAKEVSSWFLQGGGREDTPPPVPPSTHPCAVEDADADVFYSLEN